MGIFRNLSNKKFGRLTVIKRGTKKLHNKIHWICLCDCGGKVEIASASLISGVTESCGCIRREVTGARSRTHGLTETKAYGIWCAMKARCSNPKNDSWKNYGGRGIKVSDEWINDFSTFHKDMGDCPQGYSIERVDVNGDYTADNCLWIPLNEQHLNKR